MQRTVSLGVALAVLTWASTMHAQAEGCVLIQVTPIAFGVYDQGKSGPTDSVGTIAFRCDGDVAAIRIDITSNSGDGVRERALHSGNHRLAYNVWPEVRTPIQIVCSERNAVPVP